MRLRLVLLALSLVCPALADDGPTTTQPEPINPSRRACQLLGAEDLARFGATMEMILYTYQSAYGMTACLWKGREKITFGVEHFPKGANGVENEVQPQAFEDGIKRMLAHSRPDYVRTLPGVGDSAYRTTDVKNPMQRIYLLKGEETAYVTAAGIDDAELEALAKSVAGRM